MPADLVGVGEIVDMFGTTRRTIERWARRDDFPPPVVPPPAYAKFIRGRVWRRREVERWGREHLPLKRTGRPPKR
jgi:predicted DNA-binding transcriptional regulator AlpA